MRAAPIDKSINILYKEKTFSNCIVLSGRGAHKCI